MDRRPAHFSLAGCRERDGFPVGLPVEGRPRQADAVTVRESLTPPLRTAKMSKQTDADLSAVALAKEERREKARLRSERWRRAHGIMPRRPAKQPWLAEGVSRSTWYRRRKRARDAATTCAIFARAESFAAALTRDLARCAALERESMAIIAELTAYAAGSIAPRMVHQP
jgi:hypothetical protein